MKKQIIKIGRDANVRTTASSVFKQLTENNTIELRAVGAGAVNQAFKISVQARSELARRGRDLVIVPGMENTINPDGKEISVAILKFKTS